MQTRDAYANLDVAGYNYGIKRYHHDLKKYPKRIILGSETFCADAYRFMQEAKRDKRIIGDFVWAAQDYLGEVGIGVEPGTDTGVPVRAAAYDFPLRVTAKVAVCENLFQKGSTVSGRRTDLRVNRSGKTEIKMAGSENQLIKMKNF